MAGIFSSLEGACIPKVAEAQTALAGWLLSQSDGFAQSAGAHIKPQASYTNQTNLKRHNIKYKRFTNQST